MRERKTTRMRRGKEVVIPEKWRGIVTTSKTKHDRRISARVGKLARKSRLLKEEKFAMDQQLDYTDDRATQDL